MIWLALLISILFGQQQQSATDIMKRVDQKMRGSTMQADIVIRTVRPTWTREMECRTWSKGTNLLTILILSPAKDKGIAFLKRNKEVWNWMPVLERSIKLPPSMMSQGWMGTDFTNDDLVKESSVVQDYYHSIVGDTAIQDRNCWIIELIPKPEAAVVWSKIVVCIDKKEYLELQGKFYDEYGKLVNTMNAYDIKFMHDRTIPTRIEMIPADKKGHKTEMLYKSIRYNQPIDDNFFTLMNLKSLR